MIDEEWLAEQIAEIKLMAYYRGPRLTSAELAIQSPLECAKCCGRRFDCCSPQCIFRPYTATDAERKAATEPQRDYKPRSREWTGPRQSDGDDARTMETDVA